MACENPSLDWKRPTPSLSKPYDAALSNSVSRPRRFISFGSVSQDGVLRLMS
jgi:hypothetical protein